MNCPACSRELSTVTISDVSLDVCRSGCGGVWFDKSELEKFDEDKEYTPDAILNQRLNMNVAVDRSRKRMCPKCPSSALKEHYYDKRYQLEVDACPTCSGVWLDVAELSQLREQNKDTTTREKVISDYRRKYDAEIKSGGIPKRMEAVFKLLF